MIKFGYTIMYVQDVEKTLNFYEKAFGLNRKFITPDNSYGELITGDTTLSFASITLANSNLKEGFLESNTNTKPFGIEIGLLTDSVEETVKSALEAGATLTEKTKPWGQVVAYVRDINGIFD